MFDLTAYDLDKWALQVHLTLFTLVFFFVLFPLSRYLAIPKYLLISKNVNCLDFSD